MQTGVQREPPLTSMYGPLESDIFRKYTVKLEMLLEVLAVWSLGSCSVLSWISDAPFAFPHHGESTSGELKGPFLLLPDPVTQPPTRCHQWFLPV